MRPEFISLSNPQRPGGLRGNRGQLEALLILLDVLPGMSQRVLGLNQYLFTVVPFKNKLQCTTVSELELRGEMAQIIAIIRFGRMWERL